MSALALACGSSDRNFATDDSGANAGGTGGAAGATAGASGTGGAGGSSGAKDGGGDAKAGAAGTSGSDGGVTDSGTHDVTVADALFDGGNCRTGATEAEGIFASPVSPDGGADASVGDAGACGTKAAPCASIKDAIAAAVMSSKLYVFLGAGVFNEDDIELAQGVALIGGFDPTWARTCPADASITTIRNVTGNKVLTAVDIAGQAKIEGLTLQSKPQGSVGKTVTGDGESLYGLFAVGATTSVLVENVTVNLGAAGVGGNGAAVLPPNGAPSPGSCSATSTPAGATGVTGGSGTAGSAGTFTADGYQPGVGGSGLAGAIGGVGTVLTPPQSSASCGRCSGDSNTCGPVGTSITAGAGTPGCGGLGGGGGNGGRGGGASVALFASDAHVEVTVSRLAAGNGGTAGDGTSGASGGSASAGLTGGAQSCYSGCCYGTAATCNVAVAEPLDLQVPSEGAGGAPGASPQLQPAGSVIGGIQAGSVIAGSVVAGTVSCNPAICNVSTCRNSVVGSTLGGGTASAGGLGGTGGPGGGGAGGVSYSIVQVGAATVTHGPETTLTYGAPGQGGQGSNHGPAGAAGDVFQ